MTNAEYTGMQLQLVRRIKLGLEVFQILQDGRVLHQYLSQPHATTAYHRLVAKLQSGQSDESNQTKQPGVSK